MIYGERFIFKESDKERNLYYKIFAGCVFNELIPNNMLGKEFIQILIERYIWTCEEFRTDKKELKDDKTIEDLEQLKIDFDNNDLRISFDYHISRIVDDCDKGELADIFINGKDTFIAIEAKYKENFKFGKDIKENGKRINNAIKKTNYNGVQVLLITETKFKNVKKKVNHSWSQYELLKNYLQSDENRGIPFVIMFWEDILKAIGENSDMKCVYDYLDNSLK